MTESKGFNRFATIVLTIMVIIALLPIVLIVIASFTSETALIQNGYSFFPKEWSTAAYYYMVKQGVTIVRSYGI
jgi:putative aldouronate transport system permease protein